MKASEKKLVDFVERVGWTFMEAYASLGALDWISNGINLSLLHQLYASLGAAAAATVKVLIAQRRATSGGIPPPPDTEG